MLTQTLESVKTIVRGALGLSRAGLGVGPADPQQVLARRKACSVRDAARHRNNIGVGGLMVLTPMSTCRACKCHIRAKTSLASEKCPLGKW